MKRLTFALLVLGAVLFTTGCQNTPHLYNPLHWGDHFSKTFGVEDGELHRLHIDLDRIIFGVESYEELERTEYIYSE